jgi:hypothetical protein
MFLNLQYYTATHRRTLVPVVYSSRAKISLVDSTLTMLRKQQHQVTPQNTDFAPFTMVDASSTVETAFSRMNKPRRKVYGSVGEQEEQETLLTTSDFLTADSIQHEKSASLFGGDDESAGEETGGEDGHDDTEEGDLEVEPAEKTESPDAKENDGGEEGRVVLESDGIAAVDAPTDDVAEVNTNEVTDESEDNDEPTEEKDGEEKTDDATPRRSKRARKPTASVLEETVAPTAEKSPDPLTQTTDEQPEGDILAASIDNLFVHADKETVTVKDIVLALEAEYSVKLAKRTKLFVRERLKNLVQGTIEPTIAGSDDEEESEEEESDEEEENVGESEPEFEAEEEESSDFEEAVKKPKKSRKSKKTVKTTVPKEERKSTRRSTKPKKPSAVRIHAEMLRKKRMDELRVRHEELQVEQNKEDQQRAEQIAARFDTNTDELRMKRLEDRLDLLQKLDQKRIQVVTGEDAFVKTEKDETDVPSAESTSDSDSDMELEIIGGDDVEPKEPSMPVKLFATKRVKPKEPSTPVKPIATKRNVAQSKALSILDRISSGQVQPKKPVENKQVSWSEVGINAQASPGKSLSARAALRRTLLSKQRKMGNLWLARELGYKTEQDHLRDCLQVEGQKRTQVIKKEEERLKANGRKQLRERMLIASEEVVGDDEAEEEEWKPTEETPKNEEDDEELALAKEIENEEDDEEGATEKADHASKTEGQDDKSIYQDDIEDDDKTVAFDNDDDKTVAFDNDDDMTVAFEQDTEAERSGSAIEGLEVGENLVDERIENLEMGDSQVSAEQGSEQANDVKEYRASPDDESKNDDDEHSKECPAESKDESDHSEANAVATEAVEEASMELETQEAPMKAPKKAKNSGWQEMLKREAEQLKRLKKRKGGGLVDAEADEEEEEDVVAGLEDFGFSMGKKKKDDENEEEGDDELDEDDLKHVVDDLSDDEGDEEAGERGRKELMKREEKDQHKEMLRRMREGYDGRRGGIAGGGVGARGLHRFDQLVAADNREDAKRLGLLNDDEVESDDEDGEKIDSGKDKNGEIDDETALLDKMLKDRFLHRSSVEMEENFSGDEEGDAENEEAQKGPENDEDAEEREQERLAKRFAKRARMQRLMETHGEDEEFSQLRLIDEDQSMKQELMSMKDIARPSRRQISGSSNSNLGGDSQLGSSSNSQSLFGTHASGSLVLALKASRQRKNKTSFLGGSAANKDKVSAIHKSVALSHVVFHTENSQSRGAVASSAAIGKRKLTTKTSSSLWDKVASNNFPKKARRS